MGHQRKVKKKRRNDGQTFEKLVTRIQRAVADKGCEAEHDQTIIDKDTGEERQIDVLIRRKGTGEVVAIIECRDREAMGDVRWIEELYGKQRSVGAPVVVAVTSRPMSQPAQKKARAWGIQVREVRDLDPDEVLALIETGVPGVKMRVENVRVALVGDHGAGPTGIAIEWGDGPTEPSAVTATVIKLLNKDPMDTPFLFDDTDWKDGITLRALIDEGRRQGWDPLCRPPGEKAAVLQIEFKSPMYARVDGRRLVRAILIKYEAEPLVASTATRRLAYDGPDQATRIVAADYTTPDKRNNYQITLAVDGRGLRANIQRECVPPVSAQESGVAEPYDARLARGREGGVAWRAAGQSSSS